MPTTVPHTARRLLVVAIGAGLPLMACAQANDPYVLPMSAMMSFESVRLPAGERIGLVGAGLLFQVAPGWGLGPSVYGAATGAHGGLFVGGIEGQRRWALGSDLLLSAGLFVGGGGGGSAPVGSGLMLRPALTLMERFGTWGNWQAGVSISQVRFPSGDIHGTQFGLVLAHGSDYRYFDGRAAGTSITDPGSNGLGMSEFAATAGESWLRDGSGRRLGLVGARASWSDPMARQWQWGIEAAAAARGNAGGYMELLGHLGWSTAPVPSLPGLSLGWRAELGLAGGGGVESGGGAVAKVSGGPRWRLGPHWQLGIDAGWMEGIHRRPRAQTLEAWLSRSFDVGGDTAQARRTPVAIERNEWTAGFQYLPHAQRTNGSKGGIETIGASFNHELDGGPFYLSFQAHSALGGSAGAYSTGLIGAGAATAPGPWRAGVEALVGAAGGGGVSTQGGALGQAMAWVSVALNDSHTSQLRVGAGTLRSLHGDLNTPTFELAWSQSFGLTSR